MKEYRNALGKLHRIDGPAIDGRNKEWYIQGKRHRTDGPAYQSLLGYKEWWLNGKLHRTDGPALEYPNGDNSWYINGKFLTEEEFQRLTSRLGKALYL